MKVVVSAFSCCPGRGSEPGIGWNWVQQISREHEVWLLTSDEFQTQIQQALTPRIHPSFIPSFARWQWLQRCLLPGLDWVYYYWWQWKAYRCAARLHSGLRFDLAHHVTFGSWRAPSFLYRLNIPLVLGPIGGGESLPRAFWSELGRRGRALERVRTIFQTLSRRDPFVRTTMGRAALILVANRDTSRFVPAGCRRKVQFMSNAGVNPNDPAFPAPCAGQGTEFLVLFAGVLEPRKGGRLLLRAFQQFAKSLPGARLRMIGAGPESASLSALAEELGISEKVVFPGWLPRGEVLSQMASADVFVLSSLRDSGGFVLLEAMLARKPVICLDLGGPGEIVTADCGIKIRPESPQQAVLELAAALQRLAADPNLRLRLGEAGRRRVLECFDWSKKGEALMSMYRQLGESSEPVTNLAQHA